MAKTDHSEIVKETAKRLGIQEEQVHIVMHDFFKSIKTMLSAPYDYFRSGISVFGIITFRINYPKLYRKVHPKEPTENPDPNLKIILKNLEDYYESRKHRRRKKT